MSALEDLTGQLDAIAGDEALAPDEKAAALAELRERITDVAGYAQRLVNLQQRVREGQAEEAVRARMGARERADAHDLAVAEGADPGELEEAGILSHRTLDELQEEGLLPEALGPSPI